MKQECNPGGSGGSNLRWVARNDSLPQGNDSVDITIAELKNFKELKLCVSYYDGRVVESPSIRRIEGKTHYRSLVFANYDGTNFTDMHFDIYTDTGKLTFYHNKSGALVTTTLIGYFIAT